MLLLFEVGTRPASSKGTSTHRPSAAVVTAPKRQGGVPTSIRPSTPRTPEP